MKSKIAFIDPGSFVLSHDRAYINSIIDQVDVDFYYSKTAYSYEQIALIDKRVQLNVFKISGSTTARILGLLNYFLLLITIFIKRHKYTSIHFNWALVPKIDCFILPVLFNNKLVYTMHNYTPHNEKSNGFAEQRLAKKAKKLVLLSDYMYETAKHLNYNSYLLPHGITLPPSLPSRQEPQDILFIGNVKPYKGIQNFLKLSALRAQCGKYFIYGKWSKSLHELRDKATLTCTVYDNYISDENYANLFGKRNAMVVLPYLNISQSGILLDVIAGCVPFIASDRGDFTVIANKMFLPQLLFDPSDVDDMLRAFDFCVENHMQVKLAIMSIRKDLMWDYEVEQIKYIYYD